MKPTGDKFDEDIMKDVERGTVLNEESQQFLGLVQKEIAGTVTQEERRQLRKLLMKPNYRRIKTELENFATEEFLELFLRVLVGNASAVEISEIRALKISSPNQWFHFLRVGDFLRQSAKPQPTEEAKPEPMPEHVKQRFFAGLKEIRDKANSQKK